MSSHLEHHSFLSAHSMMIYNESQTVKNAYTSIKLFYILGRFSVWGFMRRDYFSRRMHSPLLWPPETRVSDGWQMHRFSFGPFPLFICPFVLHNLPETFLIYRSLRCSLCSLDGTKEKNKVLDRNDRGSHLTVLGFFWFLYSIWCIFLLSQANAFENI